MFCDDLSEEASLAICDILLFQLELTGLLEQHVCCIHHRTHLFSPFSPTHGCIHEAGDWSTIKKHWKSVSQVTGGKLNNILEFSLASILRQFGKMKKKIQLHQQKMLPVRTVRDLLFAMVLYCLLEEGKLIQIIKKMATYTQNLTEIYKFQNLKVL